MANVRKITPLIFFSLPQASSRRGIAKLKINVDLETTEAFCFTGLRLFFPLFFQPLSRLAPRPVIFPRIKLSQWNKAEGGRQRGQAARLVFWLLSVMNLSDWWDEARAEAFLSLPLLASVFFWLSFFLLFLHLSSFFPLFLCSLVLYHNCVWLCQSPSLKRNNQIFYLASETFL